jgi:hypothetical protein
MTVVTWRLSITFVESGDDAVLHGHTNSTPWRLGVSCNSALELARFYSDFPGADALVAEPALAMDSAGRYLWQFGPGGPVPGALLVDVERPAPEFHQVPLRTRAWAFLNASTSI